MTRNKSTSQEVVAVQSNARPLNLREQKNLEKIITLDFDEAERSITSTAQAWEASEEARINREFDVDPDRLTQLAQRARELTERLTREAESFVGELAASGFIPAESGNYVPPTIIISIPQRYQPTGRDDALAKSRRTSDNAKRLAYDSLRRQRNVALRSILLAGITSESAQELLNNLPKPGEAFRTAVEAVQTPGKS